jgi:hypothetical protein
VASVRDSGGGDGYGSGNSVRSRAVSPARLAIALAALAGLSTVACGDKVKGLQKGELKRRSVTYADPVDKLVDIIDFEPNIRNNISRGKFTAVFLIQCLEAIGCSSLHLRD